MAGPAPVRITVKSELPEFTDLPIVQAPIEPDITWNALFKFYPNLNFKPEIHALKSTRNVAYPEDTIQQTSDLFTRKNIIVQIIRADEAVAQKGRGRGRGGRGKVRGGGILRGLGSPIRGGLGQNRVAPPPMPVVGRGGRGRPSNPPRLFPEGDAESGYPQVPNPSLDNLMLIDDAASIASETEDLEAVGEDVLGGFVRLGYSPLKMSILKKFSKFPNGDIERMQQELSQMCNDGQRYSWSRKAPMASNAVLHCFNI